MATNNFHNENASKIFVVLSRQEVPELDDDGNETGEVTYELPDDYAVDDLIECIVYELSQLKGVGYSEIGQADFNRSYGGRVLGTLQADRDYMGTTIEIHLTAVIRSGYYEAANLDWELQVYVDGCEQGTNEKEVATYWQEITESWENKGLTKANKHHVEDYIRNTTEDLIEKMERVFERFSDCNLAKVGQFSNGEAVYEKIL